MSKPTDDVKTWWLYAFGEDRNPDILPDWMNPVDGCATCGSAWSHIGAFGIERVSSMATHVDVDDGWLVVTPRPIEVVAVMLMCHEGHEHEHRPIRYKNPWKMVVPLVGGLLAAIFAMTGETR